MKERHFRVGCVAKTHHECWCVIASSTHPTEWMRGMFVRTRGHTTGLVQSHGIGSNQYSSVSDVAGSGPARESYKELFAVDAELNRTAKGVIDRILHLRDSL